MHKPHRIFVSSCRGVLHTPHKRPSEGGRGPCLWSCTGIRHPWDGALWGVCHTPLPCYPKNTLPLGHSMRKEVQNAAPCRTLTVWYGAAYMHATYCYEDSAYHYILGFCTTCGPVPDQCIIQPYFLLNIHCGGMIELYLK